MEVNSGNSPKIIDYDKNLDNDSDLICTNVLMFNEFPGTAYLDTGAHVCIVDYKLVQKYHLKIDYNRTPGIKGLGESDYTKTVGVIKEPINLHGLELKPVEFLVIKNCKFPILLGGNFFGENQLKFNVLRRRISKNFTAGQKVEIYLPKNSDDSCFGVEHKVPGFSQEKISLCKNCRFKY